MSKTVYYIENKPSECLKNYIQSYWYLEYYKESKNNFEHVILPDGCPSLIFISLSGGTYNNTTLFGPRISSFNTSIPPGSKFLGIRFLPGTINSVLGIKGGKLRDENISAFKLINNSKLELLQNNFYNNKKVYKYLDDVFEEIIKLNNRHPDQHVLFAVRKIINSKGSLKLLSISEELRISERQLLRKFKKDVGLTLKELARIRRNREALISLIIENKHISDVVYDAGFFDQSHFNKDFSSLSGINPKTFNELYSHIEHGNIVK